MVEISESPLRPVNSKNLLCDCIYALRCCGLIAPNNEIVHTWSRRIEYAYPVPSLSRDEAIDAILPALGQHSIYSRGRFGAWKYEVGNMDHSFAQGVEVANLIVKGEPEVTIHRPEIVNAAKPPVK